MAKKRHPGIGLNNLTAPVYRNKSEEEHGFIPLYENADNLIALKKEEESTEKK